MIETSELNGSAALPESKASRDSASGGALGDCTMADLKTGFSNPDNPDKDCDDMPMVEKRGGFCERPEGWER